MADSSKMSRYAPKDITVLLMEKISQEAVSIFESEGFTVKQAVRAAAAIASCTASPPSPSLSLILPIHPGQVQRGRAG